jgi:hypothetical protein
MEKFLELVMKSIVPTLKKEIFDQFYAISETILNAYQSELDTVRYVVLLVVSCAQVN